MQIEEQLYSKFNLGKIGNEDLQDEYEIITVNEKNYKTVFYNHQYQFLSTFSPNPNNIIKPFAIGEIITDENFLASIIKKIKNTTTLSEEVKKYIIGLIENKQVIYLDSRSFIPSIPLYYFAPIQKSYLVLNGIHKAFSYFISDEIQTFDETKVIKLFKLAYLLRPQFVDDFQKEVLQCSLCADSLVNLIRYLFLYIYGFGNSFYNSHKDDLEPLLLNFIFNAQYFPEYYEKIQTQLHSLEKHGYTYKPMKIIPTFTHFINRLSNAGVKIHLSAALANLHKINFFMPYLLSNNYGLYVMYLFTYMHVIDLGWPRLQTIAPMPFMKKVVAI